MGIDGGLWCALCPLDVAAAWVDLQCSCGQVLIQPCRISITFHVSDFAFHVSDLCVIDYWIGHLDRASGTSKKSMACFEIWVGSFPLLHRSHRDLQLLFSTLAFQDFQLAEVNSVDGQGEGCETGKAGTLAIRWVLSRAGG